jgi:hypothetical protein
MKFLGLLFVLFVATTGLAYAQNEPEPEGVQVEAKNGRKI